MLFTWTIPLTHPPLDQSPLLPLLMYTYALPPSSTAVATSFKKPSPDPSSIFNYYPISLLRFISIFLPLLSWLPLLLLFSGPLAIWLQPQAFHQNWPYLLTLLIVLSCWISPCPKLLWLNPHLVLLPPFLMVHSMSPLEKVALSNRLVHWGSWGQCPLLQSHGFQYHL